MSERFTVVKAAVRRVGAAGAGVLLLVVPLAVGGQTRLTVGTREACASCTLLLDTLAVVGRNDPFGDVRHVDVAIRNSRGEIIVGHVGSGTLSVYSAAGTFSRTVGRRGQGPGEFQSILALKLGRNDTLHVFDAGNGRRSVYTPDFRLVRTTRLPNSFVRNQVVLLGGDRVVVNATIRTQERVGLPLHLVDADLGIVRSFGSPERTAIVRRSSTADSRVLVPSASGALWSAELPRYRIERWSESGRLELLLEKQTDWPASAPPDGSPDEFKPRPEVRALWDDGVGRLWVFVLVADANWRGGLEPLTRDGVTIGFQVGDPGRLFDTIVDVIDTSTGQLVASRRLDSYVSWVGEDGEIVVGGREPDGTEYLQFTRAVLRGAPSTR